MRQRGLLPRPFWKSSLTRASGLCLRFVWRCPSLALRLVAEAARRADHSCFWRRITVFLPSVAAWISTVMPLVAEALANASFASLLVLTAFLFTLRISIPGLI